MEGFAVLSGTIDKDSVLDKISNIASTRYTEYKKGHHEWIDSVEAGPYRDALETMRKNTIILDAVKNKFPNKRIAYAPEADEVYWSTSPKEARGSDRALVDCHYDAPFSIVPTAGIVYYRVIVAVNHNNTVTTIFPDEGIRVKMDTGDFHGLDYNIDLHCVEGSIPPGSYRVLLKLHFLAIPENSSQAHVDCIRWINVNWTYFSRRVMSASNDPQNIMEYLVGYIVNIVRFLFLHSNIFVMMCLVAASLYFFSAKTRKASKT